MLKNIITVAKKTADIVKRNWIIISILAGIIAGIVYYLDEIYTTLVLLKSKLEMFIEDNFNR
jgi:hypothetical protein